MGSRWQRGVFERQIQSMVSYSQLTCPNPLDSQFLGLEPHGQSSDRAHTIHKSLSQFRRRCSPKLDLWVTSDFNRRRSPRPRRCLRSRRVTGTRRLARPWPCIQRSVLFEECHVLSSKYQQGIAAVQSNQATAYSSVAGYCAQSDQQEGYYFCDTRRRGCCACYPTHGQAKYGVAIGTRC